MGLSDTNNVITEGCSVMLMKGDYSQCCRVFESRPLMIGKARRCFQLSLKGVVGEPFGTTFKMIPAQRKNNYTIEKMSIDHLRNCSLLPEDGDSGIDNRNLCDDGSSQRLTPEEILALRSSGASGEEVINAITANSSTFNTKTKFSQEKYMTKKGKKYSEPVTLHLPSIDLISDMLYSQSPAKVSNLRTDTLSQVLCHSNVTPGARVAVFDCGTMKLVTAALLHKIGCDGRLVDVSAGFQNMNGTAMAFMNYSDTQLKAVSYLEIHRLHRVAKPAVVPDGSELEPLNIPIEDEPSHGTVTQASQEMVLPVDVDATEEGDDVTEEGGDATEEGGDATEGNDNGTENTKSFKRKFLPRYNNINKNFKVKFVRSREANEMVSSAVLSAGVWSLVVAHRSHPGVPVMALLPYLLPGCPFVIYCPYQEPLLELFQELKANGGTNLHLSETWLREYQVLPERTHPQVNMSGSGGYLLRGTKIIQSEQ